MVGGLARMILPCRPQSGQEFAIEASSMQKRSAVVIILANSSTITAYLGIHELQTKPTIRLNRLWFP